MTPLDRAARLREAAREDPDAVNPDDVLELLRYPARPVQRQAADALLPIVTEHPAAGSGAIGRIDHLLRTLDRDPEAAEAAVEFGETLLLSLARVAGADPEKSLGAADAVLEMLDPDDPLAAPASACLTQLVAARPAAFVYDVDQFLDLLDADEPAVRRHGVHALVELGGEEPESVRPALPHLRRCLVDGDTETAQKAGVVVGQIARIDADAVRAARPELFEALDAEAASVRANAVGAIADMAADRPGAVDDRQATLAACLDDESASARRNAAATLGRIAGAGLKLAESAQSGLVDLLDDPDATVRVTACQALGQLDSPVVEELLRAAAEDDDAMAVRKAAERALQD